MVPRGLVVLIGTTGALAGALAGAVGAEAAGAAGAGWAGCAGGGVAGFSWALAPAASPSATREQQIDRRSIWDLRDSSARCIRCEETDRVADPFRESPFLTESCAECYAEKNTLQP
jgi:hypothetical protein